MTLITFFALWCAVSIPAAVLVGTIMRRMGGE